MSAEKLVCSRLDPSPVRSGRTFFVHDEPRVAGVLARGDWPDRERPDVAGLSSQTRARLAAAWLEDALAEHAAIAAFARFALQLLALGAPPDLLAETQRAMEDEIEHARLCFAIASAYAGRDLGPNALPMDGVLAGEIDLAAVVVATIREGCIGETLAAMRAEVARGLARDPAVADALERIAADEVRHAALAWRFVDWAVKHGGAPIRHAAAGAFARFAPAKVHTRPGAPDLDLQHHGRLGAADLALLQRRTYDEVIRPCAAAVLAVPPSAPRSDHLWM